MEDLFDAGYVIFIILLFLFSIIKNIGKNKKKPPVKRQVRPSVAPGKKQPDDFIERKLAELLGLDVPETPPKPEPRRVPVQTPVKTVPETKRYSERVKKEEPKKKKKPQITKTVPVSLRERIIWAEILGPPRARRKGRVI